MIKLENVSKFYYSKGNIATGFSKVNVEFHMGEFVAITGESGSGKSTLLNVISGLDSYEEGEMYIHGEETSHYTEKDFEEYRRKYIGNIYQNFNLVNSYTVYQNIELVMMLNGYSASETRKKVNELIHTVKLDQYKNTKASRLSGGQKQRVAIARALAKETPIIIADEPTGSLDVKNANEIFALLHEISKDKLVVIVTHNFEQVEPYITRKIRMHDGKILEDLVLHPTKQIEPEIVEYKKINVVNTIRLGLRNTFNLLPKFLLLLSVFLFISIALSSEYSTLKKSEYVSEETGYNYIFGNTDTSRIVIKKNDKSPISEEEYSAIDQLDNVKEVVKADLTLDMTIDFTNNEHYFYGYVLNSKMISEEDLIAGRLPENEYEIVLKSSYWEATEDLIGQKVYRSDETTNYESDLSKPYTIVGVIQYDGWVATYYVTEEAFKDFNYSINQNYSQLKINFLGKIFDTDTYEYNEDGDYGYSYQLSGNEKVAKGTAWISTDFNQYAPNNKAINQSMSITVSNTYYTDTVGLVVTQTYDESNCKGLLGIDKKNLNSNIIYVNPEDYISLFNKAPYQSSVFIEDGHKLNETLKGLEDLGFTTLSLRKARIQTGEAKILSIIRTGVTIALVCVLFFISYFVIRIIFRSRNVYYATLRMLGASQNVSRNLLVIELFAVSLLSQGLVLLAIQGQKLGFYHMGVISTMLEYLSLSDYAILFSLPVMMSILIGIRYANRLFVNSTMETMREEQ